MLTLLKKKHIFSIIYELLSSFLLKKYKDDFTIRKNIHTRDQRLIKIN